MQQPPVCIPSTAAALQSAGPWALPGRLYHSQTFHVASCPLTRSCRPSNVAPSSACTALAAPASSSCTARHGTAQHSSMAHHITSHVISKMTVQYMCQNFTVVLAWGQHYAGKQERLLVRHSREARRYMQARVAVISDRSEVGLLKAGTASCTGCANGASQMLMTYLNKPKAFRAPCMV
jgi:hypothetical protein